MARLVYGCRFDLRDTDGLSNVVDAYRIWLEDHYIRLRGISDFSFNPTKLGHVDDLPDNHSLSSIIHEINSDKVIQIRWYFPDDKDTSLRWNNLVRIGQFYNLCSIEHSISIESIEYNISPARLSIGSPRVIRDICAEIPAYIGDMEVLAKPYDVTQDQLEHLIELLFSNRRNLPVIVLSPYSGGDHNLINADKLSQNLAAMAIIVRISDPEVTWDFADEIGRQLSCFNGAARIYWPGFSLQQSPYHHKLFLSTWIEKVNPEVASRIIQQAIFDVAVFRFSGDRKIANLIRKVEAQKRQKSLDEMKKSVGEEFLEEYEQDLLRIEELEDKIQELESENLNLKENQQVLISRSWESEDNVDVSEDDYLEFQSVLEAVEKAAEVCENLEFLRSAYRVAEESPFRRPFDIYKALCDLDEFVVEWRERHAEAGSGIEIIQYLRSRGWSRRSSMRISPTARGKFARFYEFEYQGRRQFFEPHITLGSGDKNSCASIHFIFDGEREKIIIAHVGEHLPNTKT